MTPERKKLFEALPEQFSPADIRSRAKQLFPGRQWLHDASWSGTVIKDFRMAGLVNKVKRGVYRKIKKTEAKS